jgi:filamentous hemagglutinin family protein
MRIKPFVFSFFLIPFFLIAKPHGHECINGNVQFVHPSKSQLQITASDKAIINWKEFSIDLGESVQFIQPQAFSAVLNRVTTGNPSKLFGTLNANGIVYLINPNGIIIGKEGTINTQSCCG